MDRTWREPRTSKASAETKKVIAAIEQRARNWFPPVPIDGEHEDRFRRLLAEAPRAVREAKFAQTGLDLMLAWWVSDGYEPDPDRMLSAVHIAAFRDAMRQWGYTGGTTNEYIPGLDVLATFLRPEHRKEMKALEITTTEKRRYALPYTDDAMWTFFLWAWAQPTAELRDAFLSMLYLGAGIGLYPTPMTGVRGTEVCAFDDGFPRVRVGAGWLQVRPRYASGLLAVAARTGEDLLVPKATRRNKTSPIKGEFILPDDELELKVERLVATFRWWFGRHCGPDALVEQSGLNALIHLVDIYRQLGLPSRPVEADWCLQDDLEDGPWSPDWHVKQSRKPGRRSRKKPA